MIFIKLNDGTTQNLPTIAYITRNKNDIIYKPARGSLNDIVEHFETEEEAIKREEELNRLLLTK